jgi:diguanylate cyclase (GGDEF)-like protein
MVVVRHVTLDHVVEHIAERHATTGRSRVVLAAAVAVVASIDWVVVVTDGPVLLWVPLVAAAVLAEQRIEAMLVVVVSVVVGVLSAPEGASAGAIATGAVARAAGLALVVAVTTWAVRAARELAHRSRTDPATGLLNRAGFLSVLERERERARRGDSTLSLVYLDLDGLKRANDIHGHAVGDELLLRFATHLDRTRRTVDVAARLGGDEFGLLLPGTDAAGVAQVLERLFGALDRDARCLPVSAGAATWLLPPRAEEMLRVADEAMYRAKRSGGQSWVLADVDQMVTTQGASNGPGRR